MDVAIALIALALHFNLTSSNQSQFATVYSSLANAVADALQQNKRDGFLNSLAGFFAVVLLIFPLVFAVETARNFESFRPLIDLAVLLAILRAKPLQLELQQTKQKVIKGDESLDAVIATSLRSLHDRAAALLFYYAVAGVSAALLFYLLNEIYRAWHGTQRSRRFTNVCDALFAILRIPTVFWSMIIYIIFGATSKSFRCAWRQRHWFVDRIDGVLLSGGAGALGIGLLRAPGLLARYQHNRIGDGRNPIAADLTRVEKLLKRSIAATIALLVVITMVKATL